MITLTHDSVYAVINPDGAWLETLGDEDGAVLFPKSEFVTPTGETKVRGGMHVCLPNFGPGGDSGLAQHGFGRTSEWGVIAQSGNSVTLRLQHSPQHPALYTGLEATLQYTLGTQQLMTVLRVKNVEKKIIRIAPGFHPYVHLDESDTAVLVNNKLYELSELAGTEFITAESITLKTAERSFSFAQENLSTWAVWTDCLANYVCVEPTFGGYRFLEPPTPEERLTPGAEKTFSCTISW